MRDHLASILSAATFVSTGGMLAAMHDPLVHQALGAALSAAVSWGVVRLLNLQRRKVSPKVEAALERVEGEVGPDVLPLVEKYGAEILAALAHRLEERAAAPKDGAK